MFKRKPVEEKLGGIIQNTEAPEFFRDDIAKYITKRNEERGPYGFQIEVLEVKSGAAKISFMITDQDERLMWKALEPRWLRVGEKFTITNIAKAFVFKYNTAPEQSRS